MPVSISLRLSPADASSHESIVKAICQNIGKPPSSVAGYQILKKSIDARGKAVLINLSVSAFINEPFRVPEPLTFHFENVTAAKKSVLIIGAGPAGLFAALKLIEKGIKPIIIERGKDVKSRRRDLAVLNKEGIINPDSNYCFGEGGAGTYSDGKLYTRSNKRGNINRILQLFVSFGAPENILYDAHPHIGTNKLPQIITAMREKIIECGGEVWFDCKLSDIVLEKGKIKHIVNQRGDQFTADAYLLATGHSARDIFELLHHKNILIEAKPFALGVRAEHPQSLIDSIQYHCDLRSEFLPPASYSLVEQVKEKGVFSFCMCPGGIIAPASTSPDELVVNGWSPSKRNNAHANSGIVVQVSDKDAFEHLQHLNIPADHPLLFLYFQQMVERKAYSAGGGKFVAPAQRMVDFCENRLSQQIPENSYLPGLQSAELRNVLPTFVTETLQDGFRKFGKKMKGYYSNEAVIVATESRTSSPVRIPRDNENGQHPQVSNLYPCGEGAGYAGGIVSAAMDGERVADWISQQFST
jgi:uncharacterized FAD-dependent dehydrogenase